MIVARYGERNCFEINIGFSCPTTKDIRCACMDIMKSILAERNDVIDIRHIGETIRICRKDDERVEISLAEIAIEIAKGLAKAKPFPHIKTQTGMETSPIRPIHVLRRPRPNYIHDPVYAIQ